MPRKPRWTWWQPAGNELVTQWRTTPVVYDVTGDGLADLVMLDPEGYLALYQRERRDGRLVLLPPERVFQNADGHRCDSMTGLRVVVAVENYASSIGMAMATGIFC